MELFKKKKKWSEQSNVAKAIIFYPKQSVPVLVYSSKQTKWVFHVLFTFLHEEIVYPHKRRHSR